MPHHIPPDTKPRLTKEQHDVLETHFQSQHKPDTNTKKYLAASLHVQIEKVNNWFQNRRAKSKQDARKQAELNHFQGQPPEPRMAASCSDSEPSPSLASSDFLPTMPPWSTESPQDVTWGTPPLQQFQGIALPAASTHIAGAHTTDVPSDLDSYRFQTHHANHHTGESQEELNRRTMTQDQFDAIVRDGGIAAGARGWEQLQANLSGHGELFYQSYPSWGPVWEHAQSQGHPPATHPPISSDSTAPAGATMPEFPMSNAMQHGNPTAATADWDTSRSSSASIAQSEASEAPFLPLRTSSAASSSHWKADASVPPNVHFNGQPFTSAPADTQSHSPDQIPSAYPLVSNEAMPPQDLQADLLSISMNSVGIQTPRPPSVASFKAPAPPASIAARRQRRPPPIGLCAAPRSSSLSATALPLSPANANPQQQNLTSGQQLRRIRSSNVMGGLAQGRVMKPGPAAQRSPLNWSFADSLHSPSSRQPSGQSSLVPPTPPSLQDCHPQPPQWCDSANLGPYHSGVAVSHPPMSASPPQTPLYHQHYHYIVPAPAARFVSAEYTPPQSAPACQQTFALGAYTRRASHQSGSMSEHAMLSAAGAAGAAEAAPSSSSHYLDMLPPDAPQCMPMSSQPVSGSPLTTSAPPQQHGLAAAPVAPYADMAPPSLPVDPHASFPLSFPPDAHFPQPPLAVFSSYPLPYSASAPAPRPPFRRLASDKPAKEELCVHYYDPPKDLKVKSSSVKKVDGGGGGGGTGPRLYTFDNAVPEDFERERKTSQGGG